MNELFENALRIQNYLEKSYPDNAKTMLKRLSRLNVYMAQSGKMLSDAIRLRDRAVTNLYAQHKILIMEMPANIVGKFVDAFCEEENRMVEWLRHINKTCVCQSENLRAQIDYIMHCEN